MRSEDSYSADPVGPPLGRTVVPTKFGGFKGLGSFVLALVSHPLLYALDYPL